MAAYMIVEIAKMKDPEGFAEYAERVAPTLAAHGARRVVLSDQIEVLNGSWNPERIVVVEFESQERIREWYESPEYQAIVPLRDRSADLKMISVPGA